MLNVYLLIHTDKEAGGEEYRRVFATRELAREILVEIAEEVLDRNPWCTGAELEACERIGDYAMGDDYFYLVDTCEVSIESQPVTEES